MSKGKSEQKKSPQGDNILQSFCARVIALCHEVEGANSLLYLKGLQGTAQRLGLEAAGIQDIYCGGRPLRKEPR